MIGKIPSGPVTPPKNGAPAIAGIAPEWRHLAAGASLFRQGDRAFGMFVLQTGRLRMQRVTPDGNVAVLHVVRPGETFAEPSLFSDVYHCDMLAETDAGVWFYAKPKLIAALRRHPESLWSFAGGLAHALQGLRQRYELTRIRSAPDRVMQWLRLQGGNAQARDTLKDLAAELGLTHEALYRALRRLEQQGRLRRDGGHLHAIAARGPVRASGAGGPQAKDVG